MRVDQSPTPSVTLATCDDMLALRGDKSLWLVCNQLAHADYSGLYCVFSLCVFILIVRESVIQQPDLLPISSCELLKPMCYVWLMSLVRVSFDCI